jgi:hypothetical protein
VHISDVLSQGHPCLAIDDLHADWGVALGLEDIIDQVLWCKIDIAASVRVVLTEHALRI